MLKRTTKKTKSERTSREAVAPQDQGLSRRRYERVSLTTDWGKARALLGARLTWPNHETSEVYDLSYTGLAASRPALIELTKDQTMILQLELSQKPAFSATARLVWFNDKVVGFEFQSIDVEARAQIDDFLEDRMIGLHMRRVSAQYLAQSENFDHWYHGPKDTNLMLWLNKNDGCLQRAQIELDGQVLIYEDGQIQGGGRHDWRPHHNLAAETTVEGVNLESDLNVVYDRDTPIVRRACEILSQMTDQSEVLKNLVEALAKVKA